MKKAALVFTILFGILAIVGAATVICADGQMNPGRAVVPMVLCIAFSQWYRRVGQQKEK